MEDSETSKLCKFAGNSQLSHTRKTIKKNESHKISQRSRAATKALHPERMRFNSRGRAALRDAHGAVKHIEYPERVKAIYASLTLSGSAQYDSYSVGFAQSHSPTAIDFGPCGTKNSLKKHEVVCLQHR